MLLFNILIDDRRFKKDGKFSEIKYEKVYAIHGFDKPFFMKDLLKKLKLKDQLLNFILVE